MNLNENHEVLKRELEMDRLHDQIQWYSDGLKAVWNKIHTNGTEFVDVKEILDIAVAYLDGEPTTADKHNDTVRISDVNKEIARQWKG